MQRFEMRRSVHYGNGSCLADFAMALLWWARRGQGLRYRNGFYSLMAMTTQHRFRNKYRLQIREKDHLPMHCHLVGGNVDVAIDLETLTVQEGRWPADLAREVLEWVSEHQQELIEEWRKWHP